MIKEKKKNRDRKSRILKLFKGEKVWGKREERYRKDKRTNSKDKNVQRDKRKGIKHA